MQKRLSVLASNEEEALEKASLAFKVSKDLLYADFLGELDGKMNFDVILDISLALKGKEYLENILTYFDPSVVINTKYNNNETNLEFNVDINKDVSRLLIGSKGKTLSSLQVLLKKYLETFTSDKLIVSLDICNYLETQKLNLINLAKRVAKEVIKTKIAVKLDPMSPYQRFIIHEALHAFTEIKTESEGVGNKRAVVISLK